jgi:hypothetical protein
MGIVVRAVTRQEPPAATLDFATATAAPGVAALRVMVDGVERAYLTVGSKTVTMTGQLRTFVDKKRIGAIYQDDFTRTTTASWGTSPFYGSWSVLNVPNSAFSTTGTVGRIVTSTDNTSHYAVLNDEVLGADVKIRFRVGTLTGSGAPCQFGLVQCFSDTSNHYRARIVVKSTGAYDLVISKFVGANETVLATALNVLTGVAINTWLQLRFWRTGNTLSASLWLDSGSQPGSPTLTVASDTAFNTGKVGVRAFDGEGAPHMTYEVDWLALSDGRWPTAPSVTHSTWVRTLTSPYTAWNSTVEGKVRGWLTDSSPDVLAYAAGYLNDAPAVTDARYLNTGETGVVKTVLGEATYGALNANGTRAEGADFNDYIRIPWSYSSLATPSTDNPETAEQYMLDASGYVRMLYGFQMGLPMSLSSGSDLNGLNLPRLSTFTGPSGPGVSIAAAVSSAPSISNIRIGDVVTFSSSSASGLAGDNASDVETADDHIGVYLGLDGSGNRVFISSRKIANGPSFGPIGGVPYLNGSGYWALALRTVRRF